MNLNEGCRNTPNKIKQQNTSQKLRNKTHQISMENSQIFIPEMREMRKYLQAFSSCKILSAQNGERTERWRNLRTKRNLSCTLADIPRGKGKFLKKKNRARECNESQNLPFTK